MSFREVRREVEMASAPHAGQLPPLPACFPELNREILPPSFLKKKGRGAPLRPFLPYGGLARLPACGHCGAELFLLCCIAECKEGSRKMTLKQRIKRRARRVAHFFGPIYHRFYNRPKALADVQPEHYLSVAACVKNEGRYLREWIEYHLWAGVEHFYIYDNGSTDNTKDVLEPYLQRGIVTRHYWVGKPSSKNQIAMYNDAVVRYKHCTRWLAIIDADEFITLSEEGKRQFGCQGGGAQLYFPI